MRSAACVVALLLGCSVSVGHVREPAAAGPRAPAKPTAAKAPEAPAAPVAKVPKPKKAKKRTEPAPAPSAAKRLAAPAPEADPALQTIVVPIRVPLALVREELEKRVPAKLARGWELMTQPGESPSVEARITVWRDAIGLRVEGDVVHVELPLRYAADIRGKAKTPFGKSVALAKGQNWGTEADPQRLTLRGRARIGVMDDWQLALKVEFDDPTHGDAPSGTICSAGSFQICVPKQTLAPAVRKKLDAEITKRLATLGAGLEKRARALVKLPARVKTLWSLLGCPIPLDPGVKFDCGKRAAESTRKESTRWLVVDPVAADLSLRGDGDDLVVEPRVTAHFERAEGKQPPKHEVKPLPPRGKLPEGAQAKPIETTVAFDVEDLRRAIRDRVAPELLREAAAR